MLYAGGMNGGLLGELAWFQNMISEFMPVSNFFKKAIFSKKFKSKLPSLQLELISPQNNKVCVL